MILVYNWMNYLLLSTIHVDNYFINFKNTKFLYMLKLRLKRIGRKCSPTYRLVVMENTTRRDGRPVEEIGYYDPISKEYNFEIEKIKKWLDNGVQPTETVISLLKKANILN